MCKHLHKGLQPGGHEEDSRLREGNRHLHLVTMKKNKNKGLNVGVLCRGIDILMRIISVSMFVFVCSPFISPVKVHMFYLCLIKPKGSNELVHIQIVQGIPAENKHRHKTSHF